MKYKYSSYIVKANKDQLRLLRLVFAWSFIFQNIDGPKTGLWLRSWSVLWISGPDRLRSSPVSVFCPVLRLDLQTLTKTLEWWAEIWHWKVRAVHGPWASCEICSQGCLGVILPMYVGSEILEMQSWIPTSSESLNVNVSELRGTKSELESVILLSSLLSTSMNASLRHYISISIPRTCLNHIINPHQVFPTTQKKGVLLWCWGWLRLVIESFRWVGVMVDLLRVPDGRVGSNRLGWAVGWVGGTSKQPSTMQETAILGCALTVG